MSSPHDLTTSAADSRPKHAPRRHRTPQRAAATPPAAPAPRRQPTPGRRHGDRHADARHAHRLSAGNTHLPAVETVTPLRTLPVPLARVVTIRQPTGVEHELVLTPGATAADMITNMVMVPPGATLVDHRSSNNLSLLFREPLEPS